MSVAEAGPAASQPQNWGGDSPPHIAPSWWWREARAGGIPAPALAGDTTAEVCIVGGGYTGLWTALELKRRDPDTDIVLLEADSCGSGASGRNGGFAMSWWTEFDDLVERFGIDQALRLADASTAAVDRIERFASERDLDVHLRRGGLISASAAPAQDEVGVAAVAAAGSAGRGESLEELSGAEVRTRIGSPLLRRGIFDPHSASVQPALLVRGLRREALALGVRVHEHSPMRALDRAARAVSTPYGKVSADRVVIATNAWLAALPEMRRSIMPISSTIVLTKPIPERLEELGWTGGELFSDGRLMVHYLHVTADGRIAFGRGGGALGVSGRLPGRIHWDARTAEWVAQDFRRFFPTLADVALEGAWAGAVDRSPSHMPFFGPIDDAGAILVGGGYSGNGVVPSVIGGEILAALIRQENDPLTETDLVGLPDRAFPPEPLRSVGGYFVRAAVGRKERLEEFGKRVDPGTRGVAGLVHFTLPRIRRGKPRRSG